MSHQSRQQFDVSEGERVLKFLGRVLQWGIIALVAVMLITKLAFTAANKEMNRSANEGTIVFYEGDPNVDAMHADCVRRGGSHVTVELTGDLRNSVAFMWACKQ